MTAPHMTARHMTVHETVARGLHFPTSLAFDDDGVLHVAESGLPLGGAPAGGRILRIEADGRSRVICEGLRRPVNGLAFIDGAFIVSEGGSPGRISRVDADGRRTTLLDDLPGGGNYHTNMVALGPDRKLYFSQGSMTNLGIVGLDAYELAWLGKLPQNHDLPGYDVVLTDVVAETPNPLRGDGTTARTGAFAPFGRSLPAGRPIAGRVPCTAAILRCDLDGDNLELVAWGVRNAYGLLFLPDGRLLATDQGSDDRGSRPVGNVPDLLFEIRPGAWYGWPDFVAGRPVGSAEFRPTRPESRQRAEDQGVLRPVLANHDELPAPEEALLEFPINAAATKMARIPDSVPEVGGQLLVCLFGDERPMTGPVPTRGERRIGRSLARVDPADWSLHPALPHAGIPTFHRPIDVAIGPDGDIWVVDFGRFEMTETGADAEPGSGAIHRLKPSCLFSPAPDLPNTEPTMTTSPDPDATTSFSRDIAPLFAQYRSQMMWRFDLGSYDAVRGNAELIYGRINGGGMPPTPFEPLTQAQIDTFKTWMQEGYPP